MFQVVDPVGVVGVAVAAVVKTISQEKNLSFFAISH
jgi:hypothetical protein